MKHNLKYVISLVFMLMLTQSTWADPTVTIIKKLNGSPAATTSPGGGSTPLLCLEGVPDFPVAPQDEAGLTKTFQTWPRGWFHIP